MESLPLARQFMDFLPANTWDQMVTQGLAVADAGIAAPDSETAKQPPPPEVMLLAGMLGIVVVMALVSLGAAGVIGEATTGSIEATTTAARFAAGAVEATSEGLPNIENLAVWLGVLLWVVRAVRTPQIEERETPGEE
jgi:hypothetical protein